MSKYISRQNYIKKLHQFRDKDLIKVVTGIRRCGKSTLLEMFRDDLKASGVSDAQILAINFEIPNDGYSSDWLETYNKITAKLAKGKRNYVFLDEIQAIPEFEKLVDGLYANKELQVDIYITGSNAYFMSSELATLLTGRYIEIKMLPLSFAEYLSVFDDQTDLATKFDNYINYGAFPYALKLFLSDPTTISEYLKNLYNTILYKDVITRRGIGDSTTLENITKFMFDNISNITTPKKIADTMTSTIQKISNHTVENYLSGLTDSFVLYPVSRYDVKGKKWLQTLGKYYAVDTGMRHFVLGQAPNTDLGRAVENIVYLELLRRGNEIWIGKNDSLEIDFVTRDPNGATSYYQVAQTVMDQNTLKRELTPLDNINDHNPKLLLTMDAGAYDHSGIKQQNVIDWLISPQ